MVAKRIAIFMVVSILIATAFIILNEGIAQPKVYKLSVSSTDVIEKYFSKETISKIMNQSGIVEVKMYYTRQSNGKPVLILVGVDKKGNEVEAGIFLPLVRPCPPDCGDL